MQNNTISLKGKVKKVRFAVLAIRSTILLIVIYSSGAQLSVDTSDFLRHLVVLIYSCIRLDLRNKYRRYSATGYTVAKSTVFSDEYRGKSTVCKF